MKSIVYILLFIFIGSTLVTACPRLNHVQQQIVTIQSTDSSDSILMNKSCSVITKRLTDFGLRHFNVAANSNQKAIEITFSETTDVNAIMPLITSQGKLEFYETYDRSDVIKLLPKGDKLFSLLNIPSEGSGDPLSPAILGWCKPENIDKVDAYLAAHYVSKPDEGINFFRSKDPNQNGDYCFYVLRHDAALDKSFMLSSVETSKGKSNDIMIRFNDKGTLLWQDLSKKNMNKSVAIVIDHLVYAAPVVKNEIMNGTCIISGNFTLHEAALLQSIINNNELPLEFKLIP
jgi:SecD/SecF fusion protein